MASPTDIVEPGLEELETYEALKFADEV
ncbi:hypothetical protein A2U01_0093831, partial [Trifolium medium]|nr:hypothetical protein [Trifolium medium]